ncbi:MAG TPA: AI-2E family transporter [Prosthecobacter sp.]|nr:AI-2E family transporter [Prosthecobacter sp.]
MASVVITTFVVAGLYVGRAILIPIALAALLSFLLSPMVIKIERWIGRVAAVLVSVAVLFGLFGGVGWILTHQIMQLAEQLPGYKENIQLKIRSIKTLGTGRFDAFSATVDDLKNELPGAKLDTPSTATPKPETTAAAATPISAASSPAAPIPVEVVETKQTGPSAQVGALVTPFLGPLGTGALALLLLICMLLQRENLRGRLIKLIGKGNISATTRAMDDAAKRVSRYLLMQFIVNATYGGAVAIGLYFIGIPSALVWGVLATVLRFIPYVGPWIAAAIPILLSLAITNDWTTPLYTLGLFVVLELLSNNVMEPLLYGASTGVSTIALIIAAVFWTWLWGPAGLMLATPLTVCLVVMGRHIPRLGFLSVLLSDQEALASHEEFYHRLLTPAANDAGEFAESYVKGKSQTALYDSVILPALAAIEHDLQTGELEEFRHQALHQEMREIIEGFAEDRSPASNNEAHPTAADATNVSPATSPTCRVLCLPARAERDGIASTMLAQLLEQNGFSAACLSAQLTTGEVLEAVDQDDAEAVCISVVPPSTVIHARYLCGKLRAHQQKLRIIIGLWGATEGLNETTQRLRASGADEVVTTLADAIVQLSKHAAVLAQEAALMTPSVDEADRLTALAQLRLMDSDRDPRFDHITKNLARIVGAPIALVSLVDQNRQFFKSQCGLPADLAEARGTSRKLSVCSQVVASNQPLVVCDLFRDRRFASNPLLRERNLRFYAGVPLRTPTGHAIGSLCVLDHKPRVFSEHDMRLLQVMAEEIMEIVAQDVSG